MVEGRSSRSMTRSKSTPPFSVTAEGRRLGMGEAQSKESLGGEASQEPILVLSSFIASFRGHEKTRKDKMPRCRCSPHGPSAASLGKEKHIALKGSKNDHSIHLMCLESSQRARSLSGLPELSGRRAFCLPKRPHVQLINF